VLDETVALPRQEIVLDCVEIVQHCSVVGDLDIIAVGMACMIFSDVHPYARDGWMVI
jgi:hypothetical protein